MPDPAPERDSATDLELARCAAAGDARARTQVSRLADPVIRARTEQFCKRFCRENRGRFVCTVDDPWGNPPADAPLCEWGNASYAWMLEDLSGPRRLARYAGRGGASLSDYFHHIAASLPFYERWKNWRFGRRVHVPTYIAALAPLAARVFLALRSGDAIPVIAQQLGAAEADIDALAQGIVLELTRRGRLYLLDPPRTVSLSIEAADDGEGRQRDVAVHDPDPVQEDSIARLRVAWAELEPLEQFVLEAMLVEERDANDVLTALSRLELAVAADTPPARTNRQQLYYFRRKSLAKLARLLERAGTAGGGA